MKKITLIVFLFVAITANAQHAKIENDTAYYGNSKFAKGDTVHLGYGSDSKKDFVFVLIGSGMTGLTPLQSSWAKKDVQIDKIYKSMGKIFLRGIMLDAKGLRALGGNKIFIDIEGSIDNKELIIN